MLVCRARSRLCALDLADVVETMRPLEVEPWAGMPSFVLGVCLIRGVPTPVADAGALFGDDTPPAFTRFVTLRVGDRRVALAVEEVVGMRALDAAPSIETPPLLQEASGEVVATLGALDATLLSVLSAARLVPETACDGGDHRASNERGAESGGRGPARGPDGA